MKCLVVVENYPNLKGGISLAYVRTRNIYYKKNGVELDVLNFSTKESYVLDGINVYSLRDYIRVSQEKSWDILICHAPNIRHHYVFLKRYGNRFERILFFFHGHEVLKRTKVYSAPYPYVKQNYLNNKIKDLYDEFKFCVWRAYIKHNYQKLYCIFVSNWMRDEFLRWIKPNPIYLEGRAFVTYNCVGELFEKEEYDGALSKTYDFITIRANMDDSKYAVDIVNELAKRHPEYKFLLIGSGEFFNHYDKASNLEWRNRRLQHNEIVDALNTACCALMPTRTDAQGVMMCEMSAFGIPVITSDIPVCHEVFNNEPNVGFISNNYTEEDRLSAEYQRIKDVRHKSLKYAMSRTGDVELSILDMVNKR